MNWICNFMFAVILTGITGGSLTMAWILFYFILKNRIDIRVLYGIIKGVMVGYLVPFFIIFKDLGEFFFQYSTGYLMLLTGDVKKVLFILFLVWLSGVVLLIIMNIPQIGKLRKVCKRTIVASKRNRELLEKIKKDLNVKKIINLRCGYSIGVPFVLGIVHSTIYLPMDKYSDEELEVILTHELCHCKQNDTFWKPVFAFTCYIFWFNPLVWLVGKQMKRLAEASCDRYCCDQRYSPKKYFSILVQMSEYAEKYISSFVPLWYENDNELKWRVICMKRNKVKQIKRFGTVMVVCIALLTGSISTYAANLGAEKIYRGIYNATVVSEREAVQPEKTEKEYIGSIDDFEGMEVYEDTKLSDSTRGIGNINKVINNGGVYKSPEFNKTKGSEIYVAVAIDPSDKYVKVGLIQPDSTTRYIYSKGNIAHTFSINQSGYYRVFISNSSGTQVIAEGIYRK